mmetsp:Transcript_14564/g.40466  ORF Transcript_14564/g.40466 Transcript_14564/m.40466 type:complete len:502 (-) Transcript_14564:146-1651(-)
MSDLNTEKTRADSASKPHLTCSFNTSSNGNLATSEKDGTSGKALLFQEKGKKSSFLLQPKQESNAGSTADDENFDYYSIPTPAHLVVEHIEPITPNSSTDSKRNSPFFFGGLQIVFSGKAVEIFLTNPDGKETYLMTCKGIPYKSKKDENGKKSMPKIADWHRAICVVPGGPRNISRLRIKLASSASTKDSTSVKLHFMKLTARIANHSQAPDAGGTATKVPAATSNLQGVERSQGNPSMMSMPVTAANIERVQQNQRNSNPSMTSSMAGNVVARSSEPPLTQSDLGAAMAGLSFMAKKTEENMIDLFKQQSAKMEENLGLIFTKMQMQMYTLNSTLAVQQQLIKENQIIMKEQQKMIEHQTNQIQKLLDDNYGLKVKMQSLHVDFSLLRSREPLFNEERHLENDGHGSQLSGPEDAIIHKINAVISSHASPSMPPLDTTDLINEANGDEGYDHPANMEDANGEEDYGHTANIEVTLVEDESNDMEGGPSHDYEEASPGEK